MKVWIAILASASCIALPSSAGERVPGSEVAGKWKAGNFVQVHTACVQAWLCVAPDIIHTPTTVVVTTPNTSSKGVCASTGDPSGCGTCAAPPPAEQCKAWLEKK